MRLRDLAEQDIEEAPGQVKIEGLPVAFLQVSDRTPYHT